MVKTFVDNGDKNFCRWLLYYVVLYINSPSVLILRLTDINIGRSLIIFHLFIFQVFLYIPTLHIFLVCLCFLPWLVKTYICHVTETGFSQGQRSWSSSLFFISLVATYIFLLRQWLEILNLTSSTILVEIFWIFITFRSQWQSKALANRFKFYLKTKFLFEQVHALDVDRFSYLY